MHTIFSLSMSYTYSISKRELCTQYLVFLCLIPTFQRGSYVYSTRCTCKNVLISVTATHTTNSNEKNMHIDMTYSWYTEVNHTCTKANNQLTHLWAWLEQVELMAKIQYFQRLESLLQWAESIYAYK